MRLASSRPPRIGICERVAIPKEATIMSTMQEHELESEFEHELHETAAESEHEGLFGNIVSASWAKASRNLSTKARVSTKASTRASTKASSSSRANSSSRPAS